MRTEEWQQDQEGMLSTAVAEVLEPGDNPGYIRGHVVMLDHKIFTELMTEAGWTRAEPTE